MCFVALPGVRPLRAAEVAPAQPGVRLAAGALMLTAAASVLDLRVRTALAPGRDSAAARDLRRFGDAGQVAGPVLGTAFLVQGFAADDTKSKQTALLSYECFLAAGAASGVVKEAVGRERPSRTDEPFHFRPFSGDASFPSGHTTTAFAAATVFAEQYPRWQVIAPSYAAAALVGVSRLAANKHWLSDVVAGACLGTGVSHALIHWQRRGGPWQVGFDATGIQIARAF
jgi:undecaprenyl-diphosphatase